MNETTFRGVYWGKLKVGMAYSPEILHIETFPDKREDTACVHLSHKQVKSLIRKLQKMEKEMDRRDYKPRKK